MLEGLISPINPSEIGIEIECAWRGFLTSHLLRSRHASRFASKPSHNQKMPIYSFANPESDFSDGPLDKDFVDLHGNQVPIEYDACWHWKSTLILNGQKDTNEFNKLSLLRFRSATGSYAGEFTLANCIWVINSQMRQSFSNR